MADPIEQVFREAVDRHRAGQLQDAERLYRSILQRTPNHAETNHNLGMIAVQSKQPATGLTHFKSAIDADPKQGRFRLSYIYALLQAGQPEAARRALADGLHLGLGADAVAMLAGALANHEGSVELASLESSLAALFDEGRFDRAGAAAARMTQQFPLYGKGWMALGMARVRMRSGMGGAADTVGPFQAAATLMPGDFDAHLNLAVSLKDVGRFAEAEVSIRRSLALRLDVAEAHGILGSILQALSRHAAAEASFREALRISPQLAEIHAILGSTLVELGRADEGKASVLRALELAPDSTLAQNVLASMLVAEGDVLTAVNVVLRSLAAGDTEEARRLFVHCVLRLRFTSEDNEIRALLIRALTESWARPSELATVSLTLIKLNPAIQACLTASGRSPVGGDTAAALAGDTLLCTLLRTTPVCDLEMEHVLTLLRGAMLGAAVAAAPDTAEPGPELGFYSALANQCFINEYVFSFGADEYRKALGLRAELEALLASEAPIAPALLLAAAAYWPLGSLAGASRLLERPWAAAVEEVLRVQVREPLEEQGLRSAIPRLTAIDNDVSRRVQSQYEENPYPRWVRVARAGKPQNLFEVLRRSFPLVNLSSQVAQDGIDILIAGCGTGQHPIETAGGFAGARVLAVDLSLNSLGYARRKTVEQGLANVEYAQADLLQLGSLPRRFDLIESVGVLHHLGDPWQGWRVLLSLLRPGGVMRLGFYSELARRNITRARAFIAERGFAPTPDGIRRCRQALLGPDIDADLRSVADQSDFFSTSACRDLLFHVQEHRMTLTEIGAFIRGNGLALVGINVEDEERRAYRQRFPEDAAGIDLDRWQLFENDNPDTFIGMYQFWVQKAG